MWYQVKVVVDEAGQPRSSAHVDLALLDVVVSEVVQLHRGNIQCWRIHRRFGQQELKFEAYCPNAQVGQQIQQAIAADNFVLALQANGIVSGIVPSVGGTNIVDTCDPSWPIEIKQVWPAFAQHQSELVLSMVQLWRGSAPHASTVQLVRDLTVADVLTLYQGIQTAMDKLWSQYGSHAFLHHMRVTHEQCKIMLRTAPTGDGVHEECWATAFTSPSYGRIWDADVIESLMAAIDGSGWHVPPAYHNHGSENAGLYASDRDMFAFLVSDESPIEIGNARLNRGFFIWNSETGSSTFGLTTFLFNSVCGNHIVWGAEAVKELKIIHRMRAIDRFYREAIPVLNRFVESRSLTESVRGTVERAMDARTGMTLEEVLSWFASKPFSKREVTAGFEAGRSEGDDTGTVWGMVQGLTAYARSLKHTNERVDLERRAGALLG